MPLQMSAILEPTAPTPVLGRLTWRLVSATADPNGNLAEKNEDASHRQETLGPNDGKFA